MLVGSGTPDATALNHAQLRIEVNCAIDIDMHEMLASCGQTPNFNTVAAVDIDSAAKIDHARLLQIEEAGIRGAQLEGQRKVRVKVDPATKTELRRNSSDHLFANEQNEFSRTNKIRKVSALSVKPGSSHH